MTDAEDRADRALVNAGLADIDARRVSAAEFAETIQHRAGQGVTYTFTPEVVHGLLLQRDRLAAERELGRTFLDGIRRDRNEVRARIRTAERILDEVIKAGSDTIGGSVAQALAVLRGEQS